MDQSGRINHAPGCLISPSDALGFEGLAPLPPPPLTPNAPLSLAHLMLMICPSLVKVGPSFSRLSTASQAPPV